MNNDVTNILLSGVGGQGIILSSDVLSTVLFEHGFDVKQNEIHGMSQRGGDVTSHIRFGKKVLSPIIDINTADYILSFELLEGLRVIDYLRVDCHLIVNTEKIDPAPVITGDMTYPDLSEIESIFKSTTKNYQLVDGRTIAKELLFQRGVNILLLGILSKHLDIEIDLWHKVLKSKIKERFVDINIKIFDEGRKL